MSKQTGTLILSDSLTNQKLNSYLQSDSFEPPICKGSKFGRQNQKPRPRSDTQVFNLAEGLRQVVMPKDLKNNWCSAFRLNVAKCQNALPSLSNYDVSIASRTSQSSRQEWFEIHLWISICFRPNIISVQITNLF